MEKEFGETLETLVNSLGVLEEVSNNYMQFKHESQETFIKIGLDKSDVLESDKFEILMLLKFIMKNSPEKGSLCSQRQLKELVGEIGNSFK
jgi:hypothetical protein